MKDEKTYVGAAVFFDRMYNDGFADGDDALPGRANESGSESAPTSHPGMTVFSLPHLFQFLSRIRNRR
jgi:hypothetical protein